MNDKAKLGIAIILALGGFVGYYLLANQLFAARLGVLLAGIALGLVVAWFTEPGRQLIGFGQESWTEAKKVVWPTRKETVQTTLIVFAFIFVMALFLWGVDWTLWEITKFFVGRSE
jgi:preprotein translocase subunit SecE